MAVYLTNIALIYVWALLFLVIKPNDKKKASFCAVVCFQWILISGLRNWSVGADTLSYYSGFVQISHTSWTNIFSDFWQYVCGTGDVKDPGYALLVKAFQIFSVNYQVFLVFIAVLFTISMAIWIYKNSSMPCLSFIVYSTLFYSFFALTGHRQTIATALIIFIGYYFIKNKKLIPFLLLAVVAFFIHKSSICFVPFFFIAHKKITWKYLLVFFVISVAAILLGTSFYGPFADYIGYDVEESMYVADTSTFVFLTCFISVVAFVLFPFIKKNRPDDYMIFYNALMIGTVFTVMTLQNQAFMRIQQYYTVFLMLILPEVVAAIDKRYRLILYAGGSMFLIIKLALHNSVYTFFWQ